MSHLAVALFQIGATGQPRRMIALSSGAWIFLGVAVAIVAGLIFGVFTRSGSMIDEHPIDAREEAPGARGQSELSGRDEGEGSTLDTHGTR